VEAPPPFDAREVRAVQGAVGLLVLAAFVFRAPWLVVVTFLIVAAGGVAGTRAHPFHSLYRTLVAPRLRAASAVEEARDVRALDLLATTLLGIASLALVASAGVIGWLFALGEAGVATVAASTGINLAADLRDRVFRR
jgi:hypothetical protein